jgi:hypothetical protein
MCVPLSLYLGALVQTLFDIFDLLRAHQVYIYEVGANGQTQPKAMYSHQGPVLSVCWNKVGSVVPEYMIAQGADMFNHLSGWHEDSLWWC